MAEHGGVGATFQALADEILDSLFAFHPSVAQWAGLHEYDGQVADYSTAAVRARVAQLHDQVARLGRIDPAGLPRDAAHDHALIGCGLESELWDWEQIRAHERHPLTFLNVVDVANYIKRNYAPLGERL